MHFRDIPYKFLIQSEDFYMLRFILVLILILNVQYTFAKSRYITTYTPAYPWQYCSYANQNRNISRLENKIFNRTFDTNTPEERVTRLEEEMFGAAQSGDLQKRVVTLKKASSKISSNLPVYSYGYSGYDNYYTPPIVSGSGWKSMLHSFGNYMMGGMPTGITPQMDPAYMDYFEAERNAMRLNNAGRYRDIRTNHGWHRRNTRRGATTGVTIID